MHKEDETDVQEIHFKELIITDLELRNCTIYTYSVYAVVWFILYMYIIKLNYNVLKV